MWISLLSNKTQRLNQSNNMWIKYRTIIKVSTKAKYYSPLKSFIISSIFLFNSILSSNSVPILSHACITVV